MTMLSLAPYSAKTTARFLPFLHHDFIYGKLPRLESFLVILGNEDEQLAAKLIAEAARSIGQKRIAQRALFELQNRGLERAARGRLYASAVDLDLPFLKDAEPDAFFGAFQTAAEDLRAASTSRNHLHRRQALDRATDVLRKTEREIIQKGRRKREDRRRLTTLKTWLDVVADEKAALAREEAENPQVPLVFVAGPALGPPDRELFRGRTDLIRIIDHDLTGDRRAPILLVGQRRLGKSSLINMLPIQLGTGTRVVRLNFQGLSGSPHRAHPWTWIAAAVHEACPQADAPPNEDAPWGVTLDWLRGVDAVLAEDERRVLVALDEIERLEDGIRAGWADTDLLDLVRAAGDDLYRVRFLLATAYPLPRLGEPWVDRLINVLVRQLGPLARADAESLIRAPMPGFPDIYPSGGVERLLEATAGHPYLIQLVCDALVRHLNEERRLMAKDDDIVTALDRALAETSLFDELWRQRTDAERRVLRRLASDGEVGDGSGGVVRGLLREGYVVREDGGVRVAVPMFADWIAEIDPDGESE